MEAHQFVFGLRIRIGPSVAVVRCQYAPTDCRAAPEENYCEGTLPHLITIIIINNK